MGESIENLGSNIVNVAFELGNLKYKIESCHLEVSPLFEGINADPTVLEIHEDRICCENPNILQLAEDSLMAYR